MAGLEVMAPGDFIRAASAGTPAPPLLTVDRIDKLRGLGANDDVILNPPHLVGRRAGNSRHGDKTSH
jgi:hypothetical protein